MIRSYRTSMRKQEKFAPQRPLTFTDTYERDAPTIVVDTGTAFQSHLGFGGAFTEAAARNLAGLSPKLRAEVVEAYFGNSGLRYTLGRVPIHSTDFSSPGVYTYVPEGAEDLTAFDMSHDDEQIVPLVKECAKAAGGLSLMATPWSPPAWLKTNNDMCYGGRLKPEGRAFWAEYICRYLLEMKERGIPIAYLSVQNEPEAVQVWESCVVTAREEGEFIANFLAPALSRHGLDDVKLVIWDHNRDRVVRRANATLSVPGVRDRVWGVGYHWYVSDESKNLTALHTLYPEKHILFTEGCVELTATAYKANGESEYVGEWSHGERYGRNIINDLNNYTEGWIDWNLVLDEHGGPTHVGNYCEAPIMVDTEKGGVIYNPSYYYIGHFSRFIEIGARRVQCCNDIEREVYSVAYRNPDGGTVVVVQNEGWVKELALVVDGRGVNVTVPDHSITTYLIEG